MNNYDYMKDINIEQLRTLDISYVKPWNIFQKRNTTHVIDALCVKDAIMAEMDGLTG